MAALIRCKMRKFGREVRGSFKLLHSKSRACSSGAQVEPSAITNCIRGTFKPVLPGIISERRSVPDHITIPEYALSGVPFKAPSQIALFHGKDLQKVYDHHFFHYTLMYL